MRDGPKKTKEKMKMFTFTKSMPDFKLLTLAAQIIKSNSNLDQKRLRILNGNLYCTDSRRLLIAENFTEALPFKVEDGFYIVAKFESDLLLLPVENNSNFPKVESAQAAMKDATAINLSESTEESAWIHSIFTIPDIRPLVDIDYLKAFHKVIGFAPSCLEFTVANYPIMVTSQNLKYIVMPMSK